MKLLIQRVLKASVEVEGSIVGAIEQGLLVFVGITHTDTPAQAEWLANKLVHLRLFEDTEQKLNRSLLDQKGSVLIISQFTLYADCSEGRRPSFTKAAPPEMAKLVYERFIQEVENLGVLVEKGIFGAYMRVSLINDGPITIILER